MRREGGGLGRVPGVWQAHGTRCAVAGKPKSYALDKCQPSPPTLTASLQVYSHNELKFPNSLLSHLKFFTCTVPFI